MAMPNRDLIDRGMGCLANGLGPFVNQQMAAAFPGGKDWIDVLIERDPRYQATRRYSLADPRFLLRVITEQSRVFRDRLSRVEQGYAGELRDAGNRWAHGEPFSADDTFRALDTMERLLTAVGASKQASEVRRLRLEIEQPRTGTTVLSPGREAGRSERQASVISSSRRGFWDPVTHADVLRAIEEYDRLGQDAFLAEYGFGRATAYLLIHHGRSYDSKAILGVAYKFATGIRIGPHEFSGGVYGAAGVLRNRGFEVRNTRDPVDRQPGQEKASASVAARPASLLTNSTGRPPGTVLDGIDPERSLIVLTCSARKQLGGAPAGHGDVVGWPQELAGARTRVLATAQADSTRVLPAWRRYTGTFYQHAQPALAEAVTNGHVVIISGGYGIVRGDEPISWYDKVLQLSDWPSGLLESALISETQRCGVRNVVAFASASTDYAKLLRRTPWQQSGINARLVTITGVTAGAMSEVPRQLGQAFSAFRNHQPASYPPNVTEQDLR